MPQSCMASIQTVPNPMLPMETLALEKLWSAMTVISLTVAYPRQKEEEAIFIHSRKHGLGGIQI